MGLGWGSMGWAEYECDSLRPGRRANDEGHSVDESGSGFFFLRRGGPRFESRSGSDGMVKAE